MYDVFDWARVLLVTGFSPIASDSVRFVHKQSFLTAMVAAIVRLQWLLLLSDDLSKATSRAM